MPDPYRAMDLREGFKLCLEATESPEHRASSATPRCNSAAILGGVSKGDRDNKINEFAWSLAGRNMPKPEAELLICHAARNCDPPFSEREALTKLERAYRQCKPRRQRDAKEMARPPSGISFQDLQRKELPPPIWIAEGLVIAGLLLLAGAPKTRKSWLAMCLSLAVAYGEPFLRQFGCRPGEALHLALEDNERRFQGRLNMLCGDRPAPSNAYFYSQWPRLDDGGVDHIHKWLDEHPAARLVVIDTLAKLRPQAKSRGGNSYQTDYDDLAELQTLAGQRGVAVLMIHHTRKGESPDDVMDEISGTRGLSGAADTLMVLKSESRENVDATLHLTGRDVDSTSLALRFERDSGSWSYVGTTAEILLSKERRDVRDALLAGQQPMSIGELADRVGRNYRAVQKTLERLLKDGLVSRATRGSYQITDTDLAAWESTYDAL